MFKILLVTFLILAFVPPVRRFLFWLIVGKQMVNEQRKTNRSQHRPVKKEGEINVDYVPKDAKGKDLGGQYIDYEEVD